MDFSHEFTCDGTTHTDTFRVDAGLTEYGFGALAEGQTYVQFCLTPPETGSDQMPAWIVLDDRFVPAT